ncbi:hypothetical protein [Glycomyces xiaoerkulensis]|uniref:hypothetical protein n=1 Tax=Glycomyces xiaoerkulensis TaxID=2038139 RepID=UPI000C2581D7|nr:hypothetical protein [Glycomyces xiaoerkulensis]
MRKNRLLRLVLAAAFVVAAGVFVFPTPSAEPERVEWTLADETNPLVPPESPSPGQEGGGASDPDGDGNGGEGDPSDPDSEGAGEAGEPEVEGPGADGDTDDAAGGMLGLSVPAQTGLSVGVIALAFLALLPGRRMPERLR